MNFKQSTYSGTTEQPQQRHHSAEGGRDSSTGGAVGLDTCVICGLHMPKPLSRLGRGTDTFLEYCARCLAFSPFCQFAPWLVHSWLIRPLTLDDSPPLNTGNSTSRFRCNIFL